MMSISTRLPQTLPVARPAVTPMAATASPNASFAQSNSVSSPADAPRFGMDPALVLAYGLTGLWAAAGGGLIVGSLLDQRRDRKAATVFHKAYQAIPADQRQARRAKLDEALQSSNAKIRQLSMYLLRDFLMPPSEKVRLALTLWDDASEGTRLAARRLVHILTHESDDAAW